jgi:hypothetical protein
MCTSQETTCERMVLEYTYKSKNGYPRNILNICQVIDVPLRHNTNNVLKKCYINPPRKVHMFSHNTTCEIIFKCTYKIKIGTLQNVQKES